MEVSESRMERVKKFIAPTFREKGSSDEIMHFKVKGLRGDSPNSNQIVPCNPLSSLGLLF